MKIAIFALLLFSTLLVFHLLMWRVYRPRRPLWTLLILFHAGLLLGLLLAPYLPGISLLAPSTLWEVVHVCLVHMSLSLAYIITYTTLELDSPTLTIIEYVMLGREHGRAEEELLGLIRDDQIVGPRFEALRASGTIVPVTGETDRYVLSPHGLRWARLFNFFRILFRLKKGG